MPRAVSFAPTRKKNKLDRYRYGEVIEESGIVAVTVDDDSATVRYVRSNGPDGRAKEPNGSVVHEYTIHPRTEVRGKPGQ
jgi:hypothetical protein